MSCSLSGVVTRRVCCSNVKTVSGEELQVQREYWGSGRIIICNINTCTTVTTPAHDSCQEGSTIFPISTMLKSKQVADRLREFQRTDNSVAVATASTTSVPVAEATPVNPGNLAGNATGGSSSRVSWLVFTLAALGLVLLAFIIGAAAICLRRTRVARGAPGGTEASVASTARPEHSTKLSLIHI